MDDIMGYVLPEDPQIFLLGLLPGNVVEKRTNTF